MSPLTTAASFTRHVPLAAHEPTSVFTNCAILYAIAQAVSSKPITSMLALGLASYLSLYPALLLPPLILLCYDRKARETKAPPNATFSTATYLSVFSASIAWFLHLSKVLTGGSSEYLASTYGVHLLLPDLTPNVGLWWYFFIEMFDSFREFFLGVFWLHLGGYVGALCIRLRTQPLFVITTLLGIFAIFKPPAQMAISSSGIDSSAVMRYTFFAMATILYASLLGPAFYYLWIYAGSGNANFFYAITLVWSLGLSEIVADSLFAVLRDEWEVERPEMKGKDVRQI
ncbi:hypothetical protein HO133_008299 [Letharia lupina]|uniref:Uncharacterized protein n=1 Tax=Letharia lupina TaxID=560253 RepID=A0A8H6CNS6_9LECA|nr:uncharacterized protein HO133_008299 [Letharia lupina]KAF6226858.1 hypothetical protein HO133_008299 [Letharia lupina]